MCNWNFLTISYPISNIPHLASQRPRVGETNYCCIKMRRLIEPIVLGTAAERLVTLAAVGIFTVHLLVPGTANLLLLVGISLFTIVALWTKVIQAIHVSLFCTLWILLPILESSLASWPLSKVAPLLVYGFLVAVTPQLRRSLQWMRVGRFGADIRLLVLLVVIFSTAALVGWAITCQPNLEASRANIPEMAPWLLPLIGVAFALANAAVEEAIFRGIFLQALDSSIGPGAISLILQAVLFGWMHHSEVGVPSGLLGIAMATVYGLLLGFLRYRARGMLAVWLAHVGADIAVFAIVVMS